MHRHGGVYSDLDVIPKIPISKISNKLNWANVIFGIARIKNKKRCDLARRYESIRNGEEEIPTKLSNYFFIARNRGHPIWIDILNLAKKRSSGRLSSQYGVIYTTGPDLVTTAVYNNIHKYKDIAIIPIELFKKLFVHQCASSWRNDGLKLSETGHNAT